MSLIRAARNINLSAEALHPLLYQSQTQSDAIMGIPEFWIVDYMGLGSRDYLGNPKEPAVLVFLLGEAGKYQYTRFRSADRILSQTFPKLALTTAQSLAV